MIILFFIVFFTSTDYKICGIGGAGLFIVINNDQKIFDKINKFKEEHKLVAKISPLASHIQEIGIGGTFGYLLISSYLYDKKREKDNLILLTKSLIGSQIIGIFGKILFSRERPHEKTKPGGRWYGPVIGIKKRFEQRKVYRGCCASIMGIEDFGIIDKYSSFPSGHAIAVFTTATVISDKYKNNTAIPIISYSSATICGLSRITENMHWFSDVIAGTLIGYFFAKYIIRLNI